MQTEGILHHPKEAWRMFVSAFHCEIPGYGFSIQIPEVRNGNNRKVFGIIS